VLVNEGDALGADARQFGDFFDCWLTIKFGGQFFSALTVLVLL